MPQFLRPIAVQSCQRRQSLCRAAPTPQNRRSNPSSPQYLPSHRPACEGVRQSHPSSVCQRLKARRVLSATLQSRQSFWLRLSQFRIPRNGMYCRPEKSLSTQSVQPFLPPASNPSINADGFQPPVISALGGSLYATGHDLRRARISRPHRSACKLFGIPFQSSFVVAGVEPGNPLGLADNAGELVNFTLERTFFALNTQFLSPKISPPHGPLHWQWMYPFLCQCAQFAQHRRSAGGGSGSCFFGPAMNPAGPIISFSFLCASRSNPTVERTCRNRRCHVVSLIPVAAGRSPSRYTASRHCRCSFSILSQATSKWPRSISTPMNLRPMRSAANPVLPPPMYGSQITSA